MNVHEARDEESKTSGLQFFENLSKNKGMLFFYDSVKPTLNFHTRNVKFPIDIISIGSDKKINKIYQAIPEEENIILENSMYVLETRGGLMRDNGISVGDMVSFSIIDEVIKEAKWIKRQNINPLMERRDYSSKDFLEQNALKLKEEGKLPKQIENEDRFKKIFQVQNI